jgi:hypothetical protein
VGEEEVEEEAEALLTDHDQEVDAVAKAKLSDALFSRKESSCRTGITKARCSDPQSSASYAISKGLSTINS